MLTCFECGSAPDHEHHVIPKIRGGTQTLPLCAACHGKVHSLSLTTAALTKEALAKKKARGERAGNIPYGYTLAPDKKRLIPEPYEQAILAFIRAAHQGGLTLRSIVNHLKTLGMRSRSGKPFLLGQVHRMARQSQHLTGPAIAIRGTWVQLTFWEEVS